MPCLTPYRGDTSQMLLFKIASCLEANGSFTGVLSFNGRTGDVVLTLADVSAVADDIYVNESGDTMTGPLVHPDGSAAIPSISFTGDLDTGIFHPAANTIGFTTLGVERTTIDGTGLLTTTGSATALRVVSSDAGTVNRVESLNISHRTSAVPASGFGHRIEISADTDTVEDQSQARIETEWTDAANATRTSRVTFFTRALAINTVAMQLESGRVFIPGGSAALPSLTFLTASITGFFTPAVNVLGLAAGGVERWRVDATDTVYATAHRLAMASGVNQRAGDAVLVGGTIAVGNTTVTANTRVFHSRRVNGGTLGTISYTVTAGVGFTLTSTSGTDTSTVSYLLIEVP